MENVTYFDTFGVEHIFFKKIENSLETNVYRIQAYHSIMFGYFCIGFIDLMLKDEGCQWIPIYFLLMSI